MINRLLVFLQPLVWVLCSATGAWAAGADDFLAQSVAYLQNITTMEARFSQINADGSRAQGRLFMQRPGRMRLEYGPPQDDLIMINEGKVVIYDSKSNAGATRFALDRTALGVLLTPSLDLLNGGFITGYESFGDSFLLRLQDPENPGGGVMEFAFAQAPFALRHWVAVDGLGSRIVLELEITQLGGDLASDLFDLRREALRRERK